MSTVTSYCFFALFAYAIGSIPVAYLIGRKIQNIDVREVGEGNVGARNVFWSMILSITGQEIQWKSRGYTTKHQQRNNLSEEN